MERMSEALKAAAGTRMKQILARLTSNRFSSALTGATVTAVIQSSSVTTVLVVGFVSAGTMSLSQSIGVIMGANIGTTITAQIIAFKVTEWALVFVALGFAGLFFSKNEALRQYGNLLFGLGLIFFGLHLMGEAMGPLRGYQPFIDLMQNMEQPILGILRQPPASSLPWPARASSPCRQASPWPSAPTSAPASRPCSPPSAKPVRLSAPP
jgi:phosphate:Na+ symporter